MKKTQVKEEHLDDGTKLTTTTTTTVENKTIHEDEETAKYEKIFEKRNDLHVFLDDGEKSIPIQKKSFMKIIEVMPKKKSFINKLCFLLCNWNRRSRRKNSYASKKKVKAHRKRLNI